LRQQIFFEIRQASRKSFALTHQGTFTSWPYDCTKTARGKSVPIKAQYPIATNYRIEVSGWDKNDSFFVESTELEWREDTGKRVRMSHDMRNGAVLFVRLQQGPVPGNSYPVAYQVETLESKNNRGTHEFRLIQLRPRR